ncbi:MAG TPA: glycine zipper 2TM domain-containing protein [Tepidisphaeraceae bacterium]|nr:glycine zipper 2TM domain-containing protein [Tepidisphaeraceae bacterium]
MFAHIAALKALLIGTLSLAPLTSCETIKENPKTSGTTIGGVAGAAAGALIAGNNRLIGALIGGALGAGGGYLIGSSVDKADNKDEAIKANDRAQNNPVTAEQARNASTADINSDGYVTLDEVIAMQKAGLSDDEMIRRLEATGQFFELSSLQEQRLADNGVSQRVITAMRTINQNARDQAYQRYGDRVTGNPQRDVQ